VRCGHGERRWVSKLHINHEIIREPAVVALPRLHVNPVFLQAQHAILLWVAPANTPRVNERWSTSEKQSNSYLAVFRDETGVEGEPEDGVPTRGLGTQDKNVTLHLHAHLMGAPSQPHNTMEAITTGPGRAPALRLENNSPNCRDPKQYCATNEWVDGTWALE
jgi:hypothetical protein